MSKASSFVAKSSQNGSSGVAASSATTQSVSAAISAPTQKAVQSTCLGNGLRVVYRQYPSGAPWSGMILSMQSANFALILQDGMPPWSPQLTAVSDILEIIPFMTAHPSAAAPSKAAPSKAAPSKAEAPSEAAPSETAASKAAPSKAANDAEFPELKATEAQKAASAKVTLPAKEAVAKAQNAKASAAVSKTAVSKTAPKESKRDFETEIGDFVAATAADACVKAQLPSLLDHTVSGKKTVKFGFPATLMFDGHRVSVGANFNKPYMLKQLRESLGIESEGIHVSIQYAFEHLPNGKLNLVKEGEITIFVSW